MEISRTKNKYNNILNILDLFDNNDKTDVVFIPSKDIEKHIYIVSDKQVMLDHDLAKYYDCSNCFQLNEKELIIDEINKINI